MASARWVVTFLAVVAAGALLSGCRGGTLTTYRLQRDAESAGSLATDGELLADGLRRGRTTPGFVRTHAQELAAKATKLASVAASTLAPPMLEDEKRKLVRLARSVARELNTLADHPHDAAAAAQIAAALGGAADAASKLEKSA